MFSCARNFTGRTYSLIGRSMKKKKTALCDIYMWYYATEWRESSVSVEDRWSEFSSFRALKVSGWTHVSHCRTRAVRAHHSERSLVVFVLSNCMLAVIISWTRPVDIWLFGCLGVKQTHCRLSRVHSAAILSAIYPTLHAAIMTGKDIV